MHWVANQPAALQAIALRALKLAAEGLESQSQSSKPALTHPNRPSK